MTEVRIPDASNWINALEAGKRSGMADQADKAKRQAGGLMASGDYKGAAQALYSTGDLATGSAVANAGANQAASDLKLSRAAKVSEKLHSGDYAGAYAEAGTDKDLLESLNAVSAHAKETNGILAASLQSLKGLDYATARQKYQAEIAPSLKARGIFTPEQLDAFDPTPENISAMEGQVLGLEKSLDLAMRGDQQAETVRHNKATEAAPKYLAVPAGGTLERVDPGRGGAVETIPTAGQPTPGADPRAAVDGVVAATGAHVTSGLRTPEHNAEVGGVPTSRHLSDQARDIVPPSNMTLAELGQRVRTQVPGAKVIVENDHVHVQWDGAPAHAASGPPDTIHGAPKAGPDWVNLSPAESASLGPGQYQRNATTGEVKQISGTAPKGAGAFKLAPQDSKYLSEARTAAQQLQTVVPLVDRFIALNKQVGSGGAMGVGLMTAGRALVDPKVAEMKSITDRLTPAMRQGMPGAASDRDVAMFQSATVGLAKPGPANQAVASAIKAGAKRQGDYVSFLEQFAKTNGSLLGAQEEWDAYAAANPMFDQDAGGALTLRKTTPWREYLEMPVTAAKAPAGAPAAAASPKPAAQPALKADPAAVSAGKAAIAQGAGRAAVIARLREHGIDPAGI